MRSPALAAALALVSAGLAACGTPRTAVAPREGAADARPRADVLVARARALRAEGDAAGARARLEAALAAAPGSGDARLELADLLVADGTELDRASALLAGATPSPRAEVLSARLAELRGDDAGAAAAYARALDAGDDPDVRLRRALALDRLGRAPEAIAELERVRAAAADDAVARARLAALYERAGRLGDADAEWRALAEAHPDRAQGWEDLARFCERSGRPAEARAARERARAARGTATVRALRPLLPSGR